MHEIEGKYGDQGCWVELTLGRGKEPYLILNLEIYHRRKGIGGAHCDLVYVYSRKTQDDDEEFEVLAVELKNVEEVSKKSIRKGLQGKFPQTLNFLKNELVPFLGIDKTMKLKYCAVLAVPADVISNIQALIRRDRVLLGELQNFDEAWIVCCDGNVQRREMKIK